MMCKASQAACFNQSKSSISCTIHLTRQQIMLHQFPSKTHQEMLNVMMKRSQRGIQRGIENMLVCVTYVVTIKITYLANYPDFSVLLWKKQYLMVIYLFIKICLYTCSLFVRCGLSTLYIYTQISSNSITKDEALPEGRSFPKGNKFPYPTGESIQERLKLQNKPCLHQSQSSQGDPRIPCPYPDGSELFWCN